MSRPHDWPERLAAWYEANRSAPFSWEHHNCGFVACDWAREITGLDPAEPFRGKGGALGTMRSIRAAGGAETIFEQAARQNGWREIAPTVAQRGDVVLHQTPRGAALGVCMGGAGAFMQKTGLGLVPLKACRRAWRIE
jgi:hypothetical protein